MSDADEDNDGAGEPAAPEWDQNLRSYGRRRGRKLSPRQDRLMRELLPRVSPKLTEAAPADLRQLFTPSVRQVWLEIGFGGGEHLLWQSEHHPDIGLVGAEPFEDGVVKVLAAIEDQRHANVLIHPDDARDLLRWLPLASLDRVFILFPDPWPKRRHVKRRLVNARLLAALASAMRPGAELRIGTDIGDYARTILMAFQACPTFEWTARSAADWQNRPADWPPTRYEEKAFREGRRCCYLRFERCPSPATQFFVTKDLHNPSLFCSIVMLMIISTLGVDPCDPLFFVVCGCLSMIFHICCTGWTA